MHMAGGSVHTYETVFSRETDDPIPYDDGVWEKTELASDLGGMHRKKDVHIATEQD